MLQYFFYVTLYLKCVTFPLSIWFHPSIVFVHINNHIFLNVKVVDWFGDLFGEGDYLDYEEDYEEVFFNSVDGNYSTDISHHCNSLKGNDNKEVLSRP